MEEKIADPWFVAIGASGDQGLRNIMLLLQELGRSPHAIIMVVLHRAFGVPSLLREVLKMATAMPVIIAEEGEKLETSNVYIGDPDAHLTLLQRARGGITKDRLHTHRNRTIDLLFKSVAAQAGARGIGVVLSGALDDGSRGLEAIHKAGGKIMVLRRDPDYPGMPESAIAYNESVDVIGSVAEIAAQILATIPAQMQKAH